MKDIFQEISKKLAAIKADQTTIIALNKMAESISGEGLPLKTFVQIAQNPNPQMQGLVVEILIVTKDKLYDIVVGVDNLTMNTVWIAEIIKIEIALNSTDRKIVENGVERVQKEFFSNEFNVCKFIHLLLQVKPRQVRRLPRNQKYNPKAEIK